MHGIVETYPHCARYRNERGHPFGARILGGGRRHETDRINAVSLRIQLQTAYDACQGLHPATCVGRVGSGLLFRGADYAARLGLGEPQRHCARAAQCSDAGIFRSLHR